MFHGTLHPCLTVHYFAVCHESTSCAMWGGGNKQIATEIFLLGVFVIIFGSHWCCLTNNSYSLTPMQSIQLLTVGITFSFLLRTDNLQLSNLTVSNCNLKSDTKNSPTRHETFVTRRWNTRDLTVKQIPCRTQLFTVIFTPPDITKYHHRPPVDFSLCPGQAATIIAFSWSASEWGGV